MTQSTTAVKAAPAKKTATDQATIQPENPLDTTLSALISFFSSLKLTVVCLAIGLILVFVGTLAQVEVGLYKAQNDFFRSFLVYWTPKGSSLRIPVFPGGYFIG